MFDYRPRTRVVFGAGSFSTLGQVAKEFGKQKVLLVTDPGLKKAGHSDRAKSLLGDAGLNVAVFDDVAANTTTDDVDRCVAFAKEHRAN